MRKIIIIAIKNCYPGTTQHQTSNKLSMDSNQLTKNSGQWQTVNKAEKEKNNIFTNITNINFWQERLVKCNYSHRNKHYNLEPRSFCCYLQSQTLIILFSIHAWCMKAYRDRSLSSPSTTVYICKHLSNSTSAPTCTKLKSALVQLLAWAETCTSGIILSFMQCNWWHEHFSSVLLLLFFFFV